MKKYTINAVPLNRNGKPLTANINEQVVKDKYEGRFIKHDGEYYFFTGTRQGKFIYTDY